MPPALIALKDEIAGLKPLEILSPASLRKSSCSKGKTFNSFLYDLSPSQKQELLDKLIKLYPSISDFEAYKTESGLKKLRIREKYKDQSLEIDSDHIGDGMLRVMAILAQTLTSKSVLIFDEIENGINPEQVEGLLDLLIQANQQILLTTHSPIILNYLDDNVAIVGVRLIYKSNEGHTRSTHFYEIPEMKEKLNMLMLGPGEVFADTDLLQLVSRLNSAQ